MICERCGKETIMYTVSMFNTQEICTECMEKEQAHPDYERAVAADRAACMSGDYNFCGIGLPADLR